MKKVAIAVNLQSEKLEELVEKLNKIDWKGCREVHFIYTSEFSYGFFGHYPVIDPELISSGLEKVSREGLNDFVGKITALEPGTEVVKKGLFGVSKKETTLKYINENDFDEMIISTREKTGVAGYFTSSFAEFMLRHAKCRLVILRE